MLQQKATKTLSQLSLDSKDDIASSNFKENQNENMCYGFPYTRPWNKGSSRVQMAFTLFQNMELGVLFKRRLSNATLNLLFLRCGFKS